MEADRRRWILAIADDLTGALEIGAKFAQRGFRAQVSTRLTTDRGAETDVLVVDTESRHLASKEAASIVEQIATQAIARSPALVYKKTDSTLRGNIAAEVGVLGRVFTEKRLVYAGAYPDMGRTVREGELLVHGTPVHLTEFGLDPLNPVSESRIQTLFGGVEVKIVDGESNADVLAVARIIADESSIAVGPAALAGALAECLRRDALQDVTWPCVSRCLVVNGSMHPASRAQVELAKQQGCFDDEWLCFDADAGGEGLDRARQTAESVKALIASASVDSLVVFGGDTAFAIHQALGGSMFESLGEIVTGVPVSRACGLTWITKAGGFGPAGLLCDIRNRLR